MQNQSIDLKLLQSFLGLSTLSTLVGLLYAGQTNSILLRIIATVPWYPEIMWVMIVSALCQIVIPFTKYMTVKGWSNNADFFIWGAIVFAFIMHRQVGPVIFTCIAGMIGNLFVLFRLAAVRREGQNANRAST